MVIHLARAVCPPDEASRLLVEGGNRLRVAAVEMEQQQVPHEDW
jgi:hypothetical protein